jgi:hypothetical protein
VQDRGAGVPFEHALRHERGHQGATHAVGVFVHQEHTVGVAVEGQAQVSSVLDHRALHVFLVAGIDRIRRVVGKGAVELHVQGDQLRGEPFEQLRDHQAGHAVRRVRDDGERSERVEVDESEEMPKVLLEHVPVLHPAAVSRRRGKVALGDGPDVQQARLLADGPGPGEAELQPVVLRGVVAGREHGPRDVQPAAGEIDHVRRSQPDVHDAGALRQDAAGERIGQRG